MKATFYFVRHGETLFNKKGRMSGVCDSPLTAKGIQQAEAAGMALEDVYFDRAFTSYSERTVDTASYILKGRDLKSEMEEDLHEMDFGRFEGSRYTSHPDEINRCFETRDFSGYGGESLDDMRKRMNRVMEKIVSKIDDGDRVLLASHGMIEMLFLQEMLGVDVQSEEESRRKEGRSLIPNCGIMVFTYEDGKYTLVSLPTEPERFEVPEEHKTVTFYYVRHGETMFNQYNRMQGSCDSPLTENGIHQAELARDALESVKIDRVYSSTSRRAWRTAGIIAEPHGLEVIHEKGLKEVNFGGFEAVVRDSWLKEIDERHMNEHWSDEGGEDMADVDERISSTLEKIYRRAKDGDTVLLVSHGTFYLNIIRYLFDVDREKYFMDRMKNGRQAMPNGGIFKFACEDGEYRLIKLMEAPEDWKE